MERIKRFIVFFVLICLSVSLCACGGGERIYVALESMPRSLDPQTAQSDSELLVARNIYEGLFRIDAEGETVPAAAKEYDYSDLTYTFTLRDNLFWEDGKPVLAEDFVFGIKRALLPETKAPFARLLYAVSGAQAANNGSASIDSIGVTAPDSKTVIIKLDYEDENFTKVLSMPVSMPCRKDFFTGSIGKYGLSKECVLSNGPYYLARWNKAENGIRLYVNSKYNGKARPKNNGVFIAKDKEKTVAEKLISGDADIALLPSSYLDRVNVNGIKTVSVQNICWVLTLGGELSDNMRSALTQCISREIYAENLPDGFSVATSIYPNCLGNINASYNLRYDPDKAREIISAEVKSLKNKKFPPATLVYSENECIRPAITAIVGDWQKHLSAFINIKSTDKPLNSELSTHSMPFAVFPVKADSTEKEYLYKFGDNFNYSDNLVPIAYEDTTLGYRDNISGVYMNATGGYLDFSCIIKK